MRIHQLTFIDHGNLINPHIIIQNFEHHFFFKVKWKINLVTFLFQHYQDKHWWEVVTHAQLYANYMQVHKHYLEYNFPNSPIKAIA